MSGEVMTLDGQRMVWTPQPRQEVALTCPAFEVCYGGTKGCGKTDVLVMAPLEQIQYSHRRWMETGEQQSGRWVIFRKNLKHLNDIIKRCLKYYPIIDPKMMKTPGKGWKSVEKRWEFSSGFVVDLAHLDGPDDHEGYNGQELSGFSVDQAEDIAEYVYNFLFMQVRASDPGMEPLLKILLTCNPGGKHAEWIKRRFYLGCQPHNTIKHEVVETSDGPVDTTAAFIPAKLKDNKYLSARYEANLRRLPKHLQRMYLDGDWDAVEGAMFAELFDKELHCIPSFPISGAWDVRFGIDWGSTAPACTLVGARDNDGNVYIIDELYCPGITGRTYGEKMQKLFARQKWSADRKWAVEDCIGLFDYSARIGYGADGEYATPAAGISSCGFRLFDANKNRMAGIEQVRERLLRQPNGKPSLYIFRDRCPNLIRTLPILMPDEKNPEDIDTDGDDHAYDSLRYLLMGWPVSTARIKDSTGEKDAEVQRWLDIAKRRQQTNETDSTFTTGYGD